MRLVCAAVMMLVVTGGASRAVGDETTIAESTFDTGPEGWTFEVSAGWSSTAGNPGGGLYAVIAEPDNITAYAYASPAYLGDWSDLDGAGEIRFHQALFSLGSPPIFSISPVQVRLTGPGGSALWEGPEIPGITGWVSYAAPVNEAEWQILSGDWASLLTDVQEVRLTLELVSNNGPAEDEAALDNVRLVRLKDRCPADLAEPFGVLNFFDLAAYLNLYNASDPAADLAVPFGVLNFFDLAEYLALYNHGCP